MSLSNLTDILTNFFSHFCCQMENCEKKVVESHAEIKGTYKISQKMFILTQAWGGMNGVLCDASHASFTDGVWSKTHASNYSEACVFNLWRASLLNWGVRIR